MKVIDLLVKIANGESVPKKVKVLDKTLSPEIYQTITWNKDKELYEYCDGCEFNRVLDKFHLNDEIEVIEDTPKEDKKIEKFKVIKDNSGDSVELIYDGMKLELTLLQAIILDKMNKMIDKVNGEK